MTGVSIIAPTCGKCGELVAGENAIPARRGDGRPFFRCRNCERERDRVRKSKPGARGPWAEIPRGVRDRFRAMIFHRDGRRCRVRILPPGSGPGHCLGRAQQLDHIIGVKDGGALLDPDNARASCGPCNRARNRGDGGRPVERYPAPADHRSASSVPPASREW